MTSQLTVKLGADLSALSKDLNKAQGILSSFGKQVSGLAAQLGAAFGVQQVAQFTVEVVKLAGEAEGVSAAFERLPDSAKLMEDLKRATGNTVSELELMKRAVQASNFDISLQSLPKLLEFATLRAQQTGQSVDYLVDSIVTGIGRKSKLILDNLGISAVALGDKMKGLSMDAATVGQVADAVGQIAEESLSNMAKFSDNASTKIQKLSASWENLKVTMGKGANGTGLVGRGIDYVRKQIDLFNSPNTKFFEAWVAFLGGPLVTEAAHNLDQLRGRIKDLQTEREKGLSNQIDPLTGVPMDGSGLTPWVKPEQLGLLQQVRADIQRITELREKATTLRDADAYTAQLKTLNAELDRLLGKMKEVKTKQAAFFNPENFDLNFAPGKKSGGDLMKGLGLDPEAFDARIKKMIASIKLLPAAFKEVKAQMVDIGPLIAGAITDIADAIGNALAGSREFGQDIIKAVGKFAQQLGALFISVGVAEMAFQSGNPYAMIAAGAALVALGAAVNAMMSKQSQGSRAMTGGSGGPGYRPSELKDIKIQGRMRGYDMALVEDRESYRRKRVG
jgi:hypothetical protein